MVITDIKNKKIRVESEERYNLIVNRFLCLGYTTRQSGLTWNSVNYLFFWEDKKVGYSSGIAYFNDYEGEEIFFYNGDFHDKPQDEQCGEIEWKNGDIAFAEGCDHDEIKFIGLSGNKAVSICECITKDRRVVIDKFWVSDLLKEKPLTKEEIEKQRQQGLLYRVSNLLHAKGFGHDQLILKCLLSHGLLDLSRVEDSERDL